MVNYDIYFGTRLHLRNAIMAKQKGLFRKKPRLLHDCLAILNFNYRPFYSYYSFYFVPPFLFFINISLDFLFYRTQWQEEKLFYGN